MSEENEVEDESVLPEGVEDDLNTKYGKLVTFDQEGFGPFAFKRPTQASNDKLNNAVADSEHKSEAIRAFAVECLVYPEENGKPNWPHARALFAAMPDAAAEVTAAVKGLPGKLDIKKR